MFRRQVCDGARAAAVVAVGLFVAGCNQRADPASEPATVSFIAAQDALAKGDKEGAMQSLTKSIDAKPTSWAYIERGKLYLEQGNTEAALADCQAGLAMEPENQDLKWLQGEAKKPADQRFKGKFAKPPSASK